MKRILGTIALALALHSAPAFAAESEASATGSRAGEATAPAEAATIDTTEFEIGTGFDYSVGKYGAAADSKVWSVPLDLKYRSGRLRLAASVPYVSIEGPGQLVGGVVVPDANSTETVKRSGLGDVSLSAGYLVNDQQGLLPAFELSVGTKIPTAAQNIGTGKMDYAFNLSAYKSLSGNTVLFGSVGYSVLGSPDGFQLQNGVTASGGFNLRTAGNTDLGASVSYREPVAMGLDGQAVVSPYLSHRIDNRIGLTFYGMVGLNEASPRMGAGVRINLIN